VLNLTELGVKVFIKRAFSKNVNPFWDSHILVIWKKNINGFTDKRGMYLNDTWGVAEKIAITNQGTWKLPGSYVKYFK